MYTRQEKWKDKGLDLTSVAPKLSVLDLRNVKSTSLELSERDEAFIPREDQQKDIIKALSKRMSDFPVITWALSD